MDAVQRLQDEARERGIEASGAFEEGRPEVTLLEVARRDNRDLIVVGSHGRIGIRRLLMGSVSGRVIGGADCPVLVMKHV